MGKRFTWLKELLGRWALPKKNAPALPPTAPLSQVASEAWSHAFLKELKEQNPFVAALAANENLRGVPAYLRELNEAPQAVAIAAPPQAPNASPPATPPAAAPAPAPATANKGHMEQALEHGHLVTRTFDRKGRLRSYENSSRLRELQGNHFNVTRIYFFDPQADVPLEPDFEKVADQMGPLEYLRWLLKEYGGEVNPYPQSEFEGRRAVRKYIRNLKSYNGEKYLQ